MTDNILSLKDVTVTLQASSGPVEILRGIDLEAQAGKALGIVGPSGSGKTTLLMVLAGLENINSGQIHVAGHDLTKLNENQLAEFRRDNVGIIFQSFHLIPAMTALENVAVPLEFKGTKDAAKIAKQALTRVGLGHRLTHYPAQLSGGEQQRVAIARAVAAGAKIILADEPTGNLDTETGDNIIKLLFDMQRETGTTLFLVTHDMSLAQKCDMVCEVRDGKISHLDKVAMINTLKIGATFARRELRSGLQGFWIFLTCLALGVAAIALIGTLSSSIERGMNEQGQPLLGGDMEFSVIHRKLKQDELEYVNSLGTTSHVATMRGIAISDSNRANARWLKSKQSIAFIRCSANLS